VRPSPSSGVCGALGVSDPVRIGDATLYLGDCLEILPTLGKVDAVVTDPPYGIGLDYEGKTDDSLSNAAPRIIEMVKAAESIGAIVLTTVGLFAVELALYQQYPPKWRLCWRKGITSRPSPVGFTDWEPIFVYGQSVHRHAHDLFTVVPERMGSNGHPVPKPIGWATWLVSRFTKYGEIACDPFMGSGTTGVACAKLGRKFIGIEIEPKYFDIACERIQKAYDQPDFFIEPPAKPIQAKMDVD